MSNSEFNLIQDGCAKIGLSISDIQIEQLVAYKDLLIKWNKTFSLTAITNSFDIINLHILDGLSAVKYFSEATNILDVGSGMGVPAIILAIMYPEKPISAIDSNQKKTAFLLQVKIQLKLSNLQVVCKRVENFQAIDKFSIITSRAFANLKLFVDLTEHLLKDNGIFLAMKSSLGVEEASQLNDYNAQIISLEVPTFKANRYLIKLDRK
ncbi:MAG: 16S rRNA (guanine(527)-N(7))-methyltransferase RsmG [Burkholderiales bacterium]|nr:16S rRNA (guanine(527)-N(7))-methyltransferase RsmG [Burkholderiales bacterium]